MSARVTPKPLPAPLRVLGRRLLRRWSRSGKKTQRLSRLVERWGPRLATRPLPTRLPNGCRVVCDLTDFVQRQIYFKGVLDPLLTYHFVRLVQPGMTVIDAGAHVGQFTLLAATIAGHQGSVHSFEPIPATFARLREHVLDNRLTNVTLMQEALWRDNSMVALGLSEADRGNSGAWSAACASGRETDVRASGIALDSYAERNHLSRVDLIKFDIEGAEPIALEGARQTLARHHPTLVMEVNRRRLVELGSSPRALWSYLQPLGYRSFRIGGFRSVGVAPADPDGGPELANFIFCIEDLPESVIKGGAGRGPKRWACSGW